uniref:NFU1 iron-sulfur cluster scaffold homolog, mitochondrial n=1 Tax=Aceria tosichella TaxID=561515 RepID=A0A6G1SI10_9ACAR
MMLINRQKLIYSALRSASRTTGPTSHTVNVRSILSSRHLSKNEPSMCRYTNAHVTICNMPVVTSSRAIHMTPSNNMFIQVEETPNPNSLKFYPGEVVLESGTADFQDKVQGSLKSPLAKALFKIRGVKSVFFAQDFITVSKDDDEKVEWNVLKPQIFSAIMIFYTMKQPILYSSIDKDPNEINENDSELVKEIKALITDRIRPTIQEDGGDLEFVSYEDNIVRVRLQGACTSCPSSVVTLKNGIKNMLQFYIPEVQDVEQVIDEDA